MRGCVTDAAGLQRNVQMRRISIIIPTLNEAAGVERALAALQPLRRRGHELIVVDGGSGDGTPSLARPLADHVLCAPRGRASQMNSGVQRAAGEVLLFLHADTRLPPQADRLIASGLQDSGREWGRFDIRIDGRHPLLRVVATMMNLRSRLTGICTGDQAIFVRREAFVACGGYPAVALMEDVALSRILKARSRPLCVAAPVRTSARRWESRGVLRTMLLMWWLRLRFFLGTPPDRLARMYERDPR